MAKRKKAVETVGEKTYTVAGDRKYRGHEPGTTFTMELTEAQEKRALENGRIVEGDSGRAQTKPSPKSAEPAPAEPENK